MNGPLAFSSVSFASVRSNQCDVASEVSKQPASDNGPRTSFFSIYEKKKRTWCVQLDRRGWSISGVFARRWNRRKGRMVGNQETAPTYSSLARPVGRTRHGAAAHLVGSRGWEMTTLWRYTPRRAACTRLHLHGILHGRKTLPNGRKRDWNFESTSLLIFYLWRGFLLKTLLLINVFGNFLNRLHSNRSFCYNRVSERIGRDFYI